MSEETLFADALSKPAAERAAFLEQVCADDHFLRNRVEALLAAHDPTDGFLEPSAASQAISLLSAIKPGSQIGPYHLLQQIGEGGMGVVYLAEQEAPIRRRVALKVIKPGFDTEQVIARFDAERQALALMDHPNIAKVHDAGVTAAGRPYFAMELIDGVSITNYCDREKLTPRERLELFIPVCQAVQHAHQKGIIHRDLKPSNILIGHYDGKLVPKIIDFGVAKAMNQRPSDRSTFTGFGQVIGTLEYMSPEQAEHNALDIDTRSDIYSLGVILYELLTGSTPLSQDRLQHSGLLEMLRVIREEEPEKPSTRLSQSGTAITSISTHRRTEPARLSRLVRGDLDWIVMKCLEKDRARRYAGANGLAQDLERYLNDEAVEAGPPNAFHRVRKFMRRNRRKVAVAALTLCMLIAGICGTTWGWLESVKQRREAQQQARIAEAVNNFVQTDLLGQANTDSQPFENGPRDRDISVRTLLNRAANTVDERFKGQPLTEAAIRMTLAQTYRGLGSYSEALQQAQRAVQLQSTEMNPSSSKLLSNKLTIAGIMVDSGAYDQAESICKEVLTATRRPEIQHEAHFGLATIHRMRGQYELAANEFETLMGEFRAADGSDQGQTQRIQQGLADVYLLQGKAARAGQLYQEIGAWRTKSLGRDHSLTQASFHGWAMALTAQEKYGEAAPIYREIIEIESRLRPDSVGIDHYKQGLAEVYFAQKQFDQAEPLLKGVLTAYLNKLGPNNPQVFRAKGNLALVIGEQGRYPEALPLLEQAFAESRAHFEMQHPDTQTAICNLICCLEHLDRHDDAKPLCNELVNFWQQQRGPISGVEVTSLVGVGGWLLQKKKAIEAEEVLRTALTICEQQNPKDWKTSQARALLGCSLSLQERFTDAGPLMVAGYNELKQKVDAIPNDTKRSCFAEVLPRLIQFAEATNRPDDAAKWKKELEQLN